MFNFVEYTLPQNSPFFHQLSTIQRYIDGLKHFIVTVTVKDILIAGYRY